MPRIGAFAATEFSAADRDFLFELQRQGLHYFLENQTARGLVLDRQRNHGSRRSDGLCSLAATGMGCIALALAAEPEYGLLSASEAANRVAFALRTCLHELPADHGVLPHFVDAETAAVRGDDAHSTIETAWMVTGGLWAAALLKDDELTSLASHLYERVNWAFWTRSDGLILHGKDSRGRLLPCAWDRLNGETAFMYVLAAGSRAEFALSSDAWTVLKPFYGSASGLRFASADLGLFVFQYGLDLLDLRAWRAPGSLDLVAEAAVATEANLLACRNAASRFATYRHYWGLSAGDGPGSAAGADIYREYAPAGLIDGTAHLTATIASLAHRPHEVLDNIRAAGQQSSPSVRGRYGFSNVNVDANWISRDMVGIDVGAAVLAVDNVLFENRVRSVFHSLPCIELAMDRLGFVSPGSGRKAA
jgi:hypothetical protein